jgi:hypothetical protein
MTDDQHRARDQIARQGLMDHVVYIGEIRALSCAGRETDVAGCD